MSTSLPAINILIILFLCGTAGMVGQGIRAVIGLQKAGYLNLDSNNTKASFSASYMIVTLMIGFIAGCVSALILGFDQFSGGVDPKTLLAVVAAGYAGVDFIEGSFNSFIRQAIAPESGKNDGNQPEPPAKTQTVQSPQQDIHSGLAITTDYSLSLPTSQPLAYALKQASKHIDTDKWVPVLNHAFQKFEVNTDRRVAAAIGQFMAEAGETFQDLRENMRYTTLRQLMKVFGNHFKDEKEAQMYLGQPERLGNLVYANRLGNGSVESGDGYRYRGRGLIQLTGKTEYQQFADDMQISVEQAAEWCETPEGAAISACWYLKTRHCLADADRWDLEALTLKVNGKAKVNLAGRIAYAETILRALAHTH